HIAGQKMACCERCFAIYTSILVAGLVVALLRRTVRRPQPPIVALLILPAAIDGFGQLIGLWQSTPATRVLTGALLGIAISWVLLAYLQRGFAGIRSQLEKTFARLSAAGLTRPL